MNIKNDNDMERSKIKFNYVDSSFNFDKWIDFYIFYFLLNCIECEEYLRK